MILQEDSIILLKGGTHFFYNWVILRKKKKKPIEVVEWRLTNPKVYGRENNI